MLNARALSDLLTSNRDGRLFKGWYLMTTNGTLIAYSHADSITDLRRQAALSAVTWQEESEPNHRSTTSNPTAKNPPPTSLPRCVIIENEPGNTLIRYLFQNLLLVLEGGVPPRRAGFERRVTVLDDHDAAADPTRLLPLQHASRDTTPDPGSSPVSTGGSSTAGGGGSSSGSSGVGARVLRMQRVKLEALAEEVLREIRAQKFEMPGLADAEF